MTALKKLRFGIIWLVEGYPFDYTFTTSCFSVPQTYGALHCDILERIALFSSAERHLMGIHSAM